MSRKEINEISHRSFLDIFCDRHYRGSDPIEISVRVTGFARDFHANTHPNEKRIDEFGVMLTTIIRSSTKLVEDQSISKYAQMILISRCLELAFWGRHFLVL